MARSSQVRRGEARRVEKDQLIAKLGLTWKDADSMSLAHVRLLDEIVTHMRHCEAVASEQVGG